MKVVDRPVPAGSVTVFVVSVPFFSATTSSTERQRLKKTASSILNPFGYEANWLHGKPMAKFLATAEFAVSYVFVPTCTPSQ